MKNMTRMFYYAMNFNMDLSTWDVSSVVDMSYMFSYAYNFNGDLSTWDISTHLLTCPICLIMELIRSTRFIHLGCFECC